MRLAPVELGTRLAPWIAMMLACVLSAATFAAGLVGPSLVLALGIAPQQNEPEEWSPATPIELALAERACSAVRGEVAGYDAHTKCVGARLITLRADFGKDLNRLLRSERTKIDKACSRLQTTRSREGYLDCLHTQLASLAAQKGLTSPPVPVEEPVVEVLTSMVEIIEAPKTASPAVLSASFLSSHPLQSAAALLITIAVSAGVVFFVKSRRVQHACRVCAVKVPGAGDLCATCRHDAAEAVRHAAADRAAQKRALEDDKRREDVQAEEQRQLKVRAEEEARRRQLEEAHRREHETRLCEEDRQQRAEFDRQQAEASQVTRAAASEAAALDPFVVLGVARGASDETIRAAFEIAKLTYDPEEVSHLGIDAQERYAAKLLAAERAYQMLTGDIHAPAAPASDDKLQPANP